MKRLSQKPKKPRQSVAMNRLITLGLIQRRHSRLNPPSDDWDWLSKHGYRIDAIPNAPSSLQERVVMDAIRSDLTHNLMEMTMALGCRELKEIGTPPTV